MALKYVSSGTAQTDVVIPITEATTLLGESVYVGYYPTLVDKQVLDETQSTYGIWSGAGKTGTRYDVIESGVPVTGEIMWDRHNGLLYAPTSMTVYSNHLAIADLRNEGRIYQIVIPNALPSSATDIYVDQCPWNHIVFDKFQISVDGFRPSATALNLNLYKTTGGTGTTVTLALGSADARTSGWDALSADITFTATDLIVVRGAGNGFSNVKITLREKVA